MSTSPISSIAPGATADFNSSDSTAAQLAVFNNLLGQLQQAISNGDLTTTATLVNAIEALSPTSPASNTALGTFLVGVGTALNDGSVTEAQSALATYQNSLPAASSAPASGQSTSATAAEVAAELIQSQVQLSLVTTLIGPDSSLSPGSSSTAADNSTSSLIGILNAAYGTGDSSSSGAADPSSSTSSGNATGSSAGTAATPTGSPSDSPYDALVSSIQASLAAGDGTLTPALAYLQATGNFVNTSA
jgi:hypothetical protein